MQLTKEHATFVRDTYYLRRSFVPEKILLRMTSWCGLDTADFFEKGSQKFYRTTLDKGTDINQLSRVLFDSVQKEVLRRNSGIYTIIVKDTLNTRRKLHTDVT